MQTSGSMSATELRASFALAGIFGLRMLGMFIILPVFALYAEQLRGGADHTLIGLALGAYGLTQALLQIPFGHLSDRWGRKRTIYLGLAIFAAGSFAAALAQSVYMVILGRVIQGAGAVSAAVLALLADLTREENRTKAMAIIGLTIGATFSLSMIGGPILSRAIGVPGIFALTGVLALGAMAVVRWVVPDGARAVGQAREGSMRRMLSLLVRGELARLNLGIFVLHAVLMALFVVVPFELRAAGLESSAQWKLYLGVMLGSALLVALPILVAERRGGQKVMFLLAVIALLAAQAVLAYSSTWLGIAGALLVFFTGFNFLEASLPALISRAAPVEAKGPALGIYSSVQFLGTFAGASAGGLISQHFGPSWVFGFCAALSLVWLAAAAGMREPVKGGTRTYNVPRMDAKRADGLSRRLAGLPGVREAMVMATEGVAYLKVDSARFDEQRVLDLIAGET
jgi:MFS family permease